MKNLKIFFPLVICLVLLSSVFTAKKEITLYDDKVSLVSNLNPKNFNSQITTNRSKNLISIVHYYTLSDGKSKDYVENYDKLATEFDGMFKIAAMNCAQYKEVCEKQDVTTTPVFKVYPLLPAPIMNYEGKIEPLAIVGFLGKFIPNKVQELNPNNYENFLKERPNLPKAILFSDKKGVPLIFKAVAVSFDVKKFNLFLEKNRFRDCKKY
jgi:thioredoxin-like negative regulator of GroEL